VNPIIEDLDLFAEELPSQTYYLMGSGEPDANGLTVNVPIGTIGTLSTAVCTAGTIGTSF
jgi:hypothetical protein